MLPQIKVDSSFRKAETSVSCISCMLVKMFKLGRGFCKEKKVLGSVDEVESI